MEQGDGRRPRTHVTRAARGRSAEAATWYPSAPRRQPPRALLAPSRPLVTPAGPDRSASHGARLAAVPPGLHQVPPIAGRDGARRSPDQPALSPPMIAPDDPADR